LEPHQWASSASTLTFTLTEQLKCLVLNKGNKPSCNQETPGRGLKWRVIRQSTTTNRGNSRPKALITVAKTPNCPGRDVTSSCRIVRSRFSPTTGTVMPLRYPRLPKLSKSARRGRDQINMVSNQNAA